jgi:hypothetical protein
MSAARAEPIEVRLPGLSKRALGLAALALAGGALAYAFPRPIWWGTAVLPATIFSIVAGLSALWSP